MRVPGVGFALRIDPPLHNLDAIKAKTPFLPQVSLGEVADTATTGMCGAMPLKYHPGAVRAWEEAGYTVPDCAKP